MKRKFSVVMVIMLLMQTFLNTLGVVVEAATNDMGEVSSILSSNVNYVDQAGNQINVTDYSGELEAKVTWSIEGQEVLTGQTEELQLDEQVIYEEVEGEVLTSNNLIVGTYEMTQAGHLSVLFNDDSQGDLQAAGVITLKGYVPEVDEGQAEEESEIELEVEESEEIESKEKEVEAESSEVIIPEEAVEQPTVFALIKQNLLTDVFLSFINNDGVKTEIINGSNIEVDVDTLNSAELRFELQRPNDLIISSGDTYTIDLPDFILASTKGSQPIIIEDGVEVASFIIENGQVIITFNERVEEFDNFEAFITLTGEFDKTIFETEEEVEIEIPYGEEETFQVVVKPKREQYQGTDKKEAGKPYTINEDGSKKETTHNPTHLDWTVRANDSGATYQSATIIDDLGENLEIIEDSFQVYKIIRNYKNEEVSRELVEIAPTITASGFELALGNVSNAYDISYSTRLIRPDGGGKRTVNNKARIILDGKETKISDSINATWSGDILTITKKGNVPSNRKDIIKWQVAYNYGKENLGTVTLTDQLNKGEVIADSVLIYQVETDKDGTIISQSDTPLALVPVVDADGNMTFPGLDANGKAYLITFDSSVAAGLNEEITNEISDNLGNEAEDSVLVNTIPNAKKSGNQKIDKNGNPYIEWTITINSEKVDVSEIMLTDQFNSDYLSFDASDTSSYELKRDGNKVNSRYFTIENNDKGGFDLTITEAGPHEYHFVYRTPYTLEGMKEAQLANHAEVTFKNKEGGTIGQGNKIDATVKGPKAGISKSGKYVLEAQGRQVIEWTIEFNKSKLLLENPYITDTFTSENYEFIDGSLEVYKNNQKDNNYEFTLNSDGNGFIIVINETTNATYRVVYRTSADDKKNTEQKNKALLTWQGGKEEANASVSKRDPGISKSGNVKTDADGNKTIDWSIDFNLKKHVFTNGIKLTDTLSPGSSTISNIQVYRDGNLLPADAYMLEGPTNGVFTIELAKLDAVPYRVIYTSTLSPTEEMTAVKNTANITYTGGNQVATKEIPNPKIQVEKAALNLNKEPEKPLITWQIRANTDSKNHFVNLVDAILADTIPGDQALIENSIKVIRENDKKDVTAGLTITTSKQDFQIGLPDGPYTYVVTFDTEILEYPSFDGKELDKYNNATTLTNQTKNDSLKSSANAAASIRYFKDGTNNNTAKTGSQNEETENIDWQVKVNPLGLTIKNTKIKDQLNDRHTYIQESLTVKDSKGKVLAKDAYTVSFADDNRSFELMIGNGTINESYQITYSTRLNPELIGFQTVTNRISLLGGQEGKVIEVKESTTRSQQWFYGGGGSGTKVKFDLKKQDSQGKAIEEVTFKLDKQEFNGSTTNLGTIQTDQNGYYQSEEIRAGRYVLTEESAPKAYAVSTQPIYFMIGYAKGSKTEFTVTLTDSSWKPKTYNQVAAEKNILTVTNNVKVGSVTAEKNWADKKAQTKYPNTWFKLFRQEPGGKVEAVPNAPIKKLNGISAKEQVVWDKIDLYSPSRQEYTFSVREVDAEGNDFVPTGYVKEEKDLTVTNLPLEALTIQANKKITGRDLRDGEFLFELKDAAGKSIAQARNNKKGDITFTTGLTAEQVATLQKDGRIEIPYTLSETKQEIGGVSFDETIYRVNVTVSIDSKKGTLVTDFTYPDGQPVFTNIYQTQAGKQTLEARKRLEGQAIEANQFSFELLDEEGNILQTVQNKADGHVVFEELTYTKPGDYTYTIREVLGEQGGMIYDDATYGVRVTVVDDGEGKLLTEAIYQDGPASFTNKYASAPGDLVLEASKILTGQELTAEQFSFELLDDQGEVLQTVQNNGNGQVIFDALHYDQTGEFDYRIREVKGQQGGMTYDTREFAVKVIVQDNRQGQLIAEAVYTDGPAVFKNDYQAAPDRAVIEAKKILEGQQLVADQFAFELVDAKGDVLQTKYNNENGQVIFDELTYDKTGEFTYTIREVKGSQGGVTYDPTNYQVVVVVTDDGQGQLTATVNYSDGPAVFTNIYVPAPDKRVFTAEKILLGQELVTGQFTFELVDNQGRILQTVKNNGEGQVIFDEITYDQTGEFDYTIREVKGNQGGMTYDGRIFNFHVVITDNGQGQLESTLVSVDGPAVFTNTYTAAPDSVVLEAEKVLKGQELRAGQFSFELLDKEGKVLQTVSNNANGQVIFEEMTYQKIGTHDYVIREVKGSQGGVVYDATTYAARVIVTDDGQGQLVARVDYEQGPAVFTNTYSTAPDSVVIEAEKMLHGQKLVNGQFSFELVDQAGSVLQTVTNNANGQVIFDEITYEKTGEYNYTIREVKGNQGGVAYDEVKYPVNVSVVDDGQGQLVATLNYLDGPAVFTNTYTAAPDHIVLEAEKVLEGQKIRNSQFSFELLDEEETVLQTVKNDANGQIVFEEMTYEEVGVHNYFIREVKGSQGGVTYDESVYQAIVSVVDDGEGKLIANVTYPDGPAVFENTYVSKPDQVTIEATKRLEGQKLANGQFTFELIDEEGLVLQTAENNQNGQVIFDELTYQTVGNHSYTIREVKGIQGGVAYDETVYQAIVSVVDNGEGQLIANVTYPDGPAAFKNTYVAAPDRAVFQAEKVLHGQKLVNGQFTFELVDEKDNVLQTVTNDVNGQVIFNQRTYEETGDYSYTIREVKGSQGGMTYDEKTYRVNVSVTDDGQGQLVTSVTYLDGPAVFKNSYQAEPDSVVLEAEKTLKDQELRDKQFSFELLDEEGSVLQTATNKASGQVIFDQLVYEKTGNYHYTIREVKGNQGGMTYDETTYPVHVSVSDDGEGKLVATVVYPDGPVVFENKYTSAPDSVVFEAEKVLHGQEIVKNQFAFELVDEEGHLLQTTTNNANGQIIFDQLTYEKVGSYSYMIREVKGDQGGVNYDEATYRVTVSVDDDGQGQLVATVNYLDGPAVFENTYQSNPDSVILEAQKLLHGQELKNNQFTFELLDEEGNILQTKKNNDQGQVIFEALTFEEVGSYDYIIREVKGSQDGITYDETTYPVTVSVVDDGEGQLLAAAEYTEGSAVFENIYESAPDSVVFEAEKILHGQKLVNGQFSFELLDEAGKLLQTVTNNTNGQIIFNELTFDEIGDYTFLIREGRGNQEGITYDDTEYAIQISVTDDGQGNLVAKIKDAQELVFNNTYHAPTIPTEPDKEEPPNDGTTPSEPEKKNPEKEGTLPFAGIEDNTLLFTTIGLLLIGSGLFVFFNGKRKEDN
ncbi:Collagen adhesin [Jeotgalibaca dankookensis]|uniref:Collagen adhesin n=1 Tax=Jeotgalibaca dankookensis TaxID=708126 RepID=A0A1S6IM76_9LACT|nr:FctA domain-containing protein [Jeotgalibaca dankookensis]AQS52635.1 Collagen adhesin [Jeotgalibaca dankookensis]